MHNNYSTADFDQGVLWAAARLVELYDEPTIAAELLRESGADVTAADEIDVPFLTKALEETKAAEAAKGGG